LLAARDVHPVGRERAECLGREVGVKAAVEGDLPGVQAELLEFGDGRWEQRVLARVPGCGGGREDQATRAAAGVLGDLCDLRDVPEFVGLCGYPHSPTYAETATMPTSAWSWR
jgi:hypothetical protein